MRTFVTPAFERCLKGLPEEKRREIIEIIKQAGVQFGFPHEHGGLSIRPYGASYECRDALDNRLVFKKKPDGLWFTFYGNHDEVRRRARRKK